MFHNSIKFFAWISRLEVFNRKNFWMIYLLIGACKLHTAFTEVISIRVGVVSGCNLILRLSSCNLHTCRICLIAHRFWQLNTAFWAAILIGAIVDVHTYFGHILFQAYIAYASGCTTRELNSLFCLRSWMTGLRIFGHIQHWHHWLGPGVRSFNDASSSDEGKNSHYP